MKRLFVGLMATALAGAMCLSMAACGKKTEGGETFRGAVSETTYESADAAVKGFLEEEMSGLTVKAEYVGYEKEAELTQSEIGDLELGEYAEGLISAEKGQVEYRETSESTAVSSIAEGTITRTVYILSYPDTFRFFAPPVNTGETLTAKYYESVFQTEKYYNCTIHAVMNMMSNEDGFESGITATILKLTEAAAYQLAYNTEDFSGEPFLITYMIEKNDTTYFCDKSLDSPEYRVDNVLDFPAKEYISVWFQRTFGALDHTYFEKTETGYALRADKQAVFMETMQYSGGTVSYLEYTFKVVDGRLASAHMEVSYSDGDLEITSDVEFSDFGSTEVTVPDEVKALVE